VLAVCARWRFARAGGLRALQTAFWRFARAGGLRALAVLRVLAVCARWKVCALEKMDSTPHCSHVV
jgi:hypothetical protein